MPCRDELVATWNGRSEESLLRAIKSNMPDSCVVGFFQFARWEVVRSPPLKFIRGSSCNATVYMKGNISAWKAERTLPLTVTAAKMVEEKGAHATSPTLSPKSKDRTACAPSAT